MRFQYCHLCLQVFFQGYTFGVDEVPMSMTHQLLRDLLKVDCPQVNNSSERTLLPLKLWQYYCTISLVHESIHVALHSSNVIRYILAVIVETSFVIHLLFPTEPPTSPLRQSLSNCYEAEFGTFVSTSIAIWRVRCTFPTHLKTYTDRQ